MKRFRFVFGVQILNSARTEDLNLFHVRRTTFSSVPTTQNIVSGNKMVLI